MALARRNVQQALWIDDAPARNEVYGLAEEECVAQFKANPAAFVKPPVATHQRLVGVRQSTCGNVSQGLASTVLYTACARGFASPGVDVGEREMEVVMTLRLLRICAAVLFVAVLVRPVEGHMKPVKSEPAADAAASPKQVQVWFTQSPDPKLSKLEMTGPSGSIELTGVRVTADKSIIATVDGSLADGRYSVRWQAAGDDGHLQKGEFAFTVRQTN